MELATAGAPSRLDIARGTPYLATIGDENCNRDTSRCVQGQYPKISYLVRLVDPARLTIAQRNLTPPPVSKNGASGTWSGLTLLFGAPEIN